MAATTPPAGSVSHESVDWGNHTSLAVAAGRGLSPPITAPFGPSTIPPGRRRLTAVFLVPWSLS
jgi:hypothetical protein